MKSTKEIFDMLDLFYANKHLHDKVKKAQEKRACYLYANKMKDGDNK